MGSLKEKISAKGLRVPSDEQILSLLQKRERRREQGRRLAAEYPMTPDKFTMLLWSKAHKPELDEKKRELGGRVRQKEWQGKTFTKVIVPKDRRTEYSEYIAEAMQNSADAVEYEAEAKAMLAATKKLKQVIASLQDANPPRYLTTDQKIYVKRMIKAGRSDGQITEYLQTILARVPQGKLVNGKPPRKTGLGPLPAPAGITPLPPKKKYVKKQ